jgi:hypothetical protein
MKEIRPTMTEPAKQLTACCLILLQAPDVPLQFSDKNQSR